MCIGMAEASQQQMYELIDESNERNPKLDVMFVDTNTWLVELDLSEPLFGSLVKSCDGLMGVDVKPVEHEKLTSVCEKYCRYYSAKSALLNGIRSEVTEELE